MLDEDLRSKYRPEAWEGGHAQEVVPWDLRMGHGENGTARSAHQKGDASRARLFLVLCTMFDLQRWHLTWWLRWLVKEKAQERNHWAEKHTWTVFGDDFINALRRYIVDDVVTGSGDEMAILKDGDVFLEWY